MYLFTFTVTGRGDFPLDMLRYDHCWPDRQEDVSTMERTGEIRSVRMGTYVRLKSDLRLDRATTQDRWRSYNWAVMEEGR